MTQHTSSSPIVVLLGTLDIRGEDLGFLRDRLRATGVGTLLVEVGTQGPSRVEPDGPPPAPSVEVHELDLHVDDPAFAVAMAAGSDALLEGAR